MIQGGGHAADLSEKSHRANPEQKRKWHFKAGLKNDRGTIAMARKVRPAFRHRAVLHQSRQ